MSKLQYRRRITHQGRKNIEKIIKEFNIETLTELELSREEMIDVISGLKYARDIIKEMERSLE